MFLSKFFFEKILGDNATNQYFNRHTQIDILEIYQGYYTSPLGCVKVTGSLAGIRAISFVKKPGVAEEVPYVIEKCILQLDEYFHKKRTDFDILLDWSESTFFQKTVWRALRDVPYGHTATYSEIAKKIGKPRAVRAVGHANRLNPIPIIVPCHRIIGKSGKLTGYFYGLEMKRALLELENPDSFSAQGKLF